MKLKDDGKTFESAPVGTHLARCIRLVDIGTQYSEYQGNPIKRRQVIVTWELSSELREDGQPFICSKFYTASLNEKATLRHHLVNWRGKEFTSEELQGFELKNVLNAPCQVTVTENSKGRTVVSGVTGLPKGITAPPVINPLVYFSLDEGEFEQEVFNGLSDKIKEMIRNSPEFEMIERFEELPEYSGATDFTPVSGADDIPF